MSVVPVTAGETCTVTETGVPPVPPPSAGIVCEAGPVPNEAYWTTTVTPPQLTITAGVNTVTVTNTLSCSLTVWKSIIRSLPPAVRTGTLFPIDVTCTNPSSGQVVYSRTPLILTGISSSPPIPNLPLGTVCTFVELTPVPATFQYNGQTCTWQLPPTYNPPTVTIGQLARPTNTEVMVNDYTCQPASAAPVKAGACAPPMIPGPAPGSCVCPQGTQLQGNECVRPIACRPPMVPNAAATACACPPGTVQKGQECVRPIVCDPPATPNRAGTACQCPPGMAAIGRSCAVQRGGPSPRGGDQRRGGQGPADSSGRR
jgi:hypothetical protein